MSQLAGFKYLIKREGEAGNLGPILSAIQLVEKSDTGGVVQEFLAKGYYLGAKEEWEEFSRAVAGDMDRDDDYDDADKAIASEIKNASL